MGQQDGDGLIGDALADLADVADAAAGIKQDGLLFANQQVGVDEVELADAVQVRSDLGNSLLDVGHFAGVAGRSGFSGRVSSLSKSSAADAHRRSKGQRAGSGALEEHAAGDLVHRKLLLRMIVFSGFLTGN